MANYTVRTMNQQELADYPLTWAINEDWHPGDYDAEYFHATDPNGFFLGVLEDEPIAAMSAVKYDADFGFIGMYLVKPDYRGQGFGFSVWQQGMAYLQHRNIGLDGTIAQQANYQKSGFKTAYRHLRFQTQGLGQQLPQDAQVVELSQVALNTVQNYDAQVFPANRRDFIRRWIIQRRGVALGIVRDQQLTAYGVIRACHGGYRIGGWYADTINEAEVLLLALLNHAPLSCPVWIDVPDVNSAAMKLIAHYNMTMIFDVLRMYTRTAPVVDLTKVFGITSLELG
jgi:GNAT superfamily N-acetyltransferase